MLTLVPFLLTALASLPARADGITAVWEMDGRGVYETGFIDNMRKIGDGAVLFDMDLIENDSPGGGYSEKGEFNFRIWGSNVARKVLVLDDPRAEKAFMVAFFGRGGAGKYPLTMTVNGHDLTVQPWTFEEFNLAFRWIEFPAEWLREGRNTIDFACPAAAGGREGWNLYLSRADEYERGGSDPRDVGKTSFASGDGGRSWRESPFGPDGRTRAEFQIRLSLDRYRPSGNLATPVIDLWRGGDNAPIIPVSGLRSVRIAASAVVPPGTSVRYSWRAGNDPSPFTDSWREYRPVGEGAALDATLSAAEVDARYIQVRMELATANPLVSPVIRNVRVDTALSEGSAKPYNITMVRAENPAIRYPSVAWEWEKSDRPELAELRHREGLDGIVAGSRTQFELIARLLEFASVRIPRGTGGPVPHYPGWSALSILDRIERLGSQGMCPQWNNLLHGYCIAYGIQGRLVNGMDHEMGEVWSDDVGKWVYLDASYGFHYTYDTMTGEPLSMLDLHNRYLDYYYPDRPIDWMGDLTSFPHATDVLKERADKPAIGYSHMQYEGYEEQLWKGFVQTPFLRMVPRNNFYEKPAPVPLSSGMLGTWVWDGYVNWYDERTPPIRQYSRHTDRPQDLWPDLNCVHIDATAGHTGDRLFLRFETYCPNFARFEVRENDGDWKAVEGDRWTWNLAPLRNVIEVRTVNALGAKGKPSVFEVNRAVVTTEDLL